MDYKDILAIIIVIAFAAIAGKFLPSNPISILSNYIRNLFNRKS